MAKAKRNPRAITVYVDNNDLNFFGVFFLT